jgi:hypothetical protein
VASNSKRSRAAWVVLGLAASLLVPAAALGTTTVSYSPSTGLLVTGDATGEGLGVIRRADRFDVFLSATATSPAAVLAPGSGCQTQATGLTCAFGGADNRVVTANLGDGADLFLTLGPALSPLDAVIDGGGCGGAPVRSTTRWRVATGTTSSWGTSAASTRSGARAATTSSAR